MLIRSHFLFGKRLLYQFKGNNGLKFRKIQFTDEVLKPGPLGSRQVHLPLDHQDIYCKEL